jgi:hypothetical protein
MCDPRLNYEMEPERELKQLDLKIPRLEKPGGGEGSVLAQMKAVELLGCPYYPIRAPGAKTGC